MKVIVIQYLFSAIPSRCDNCSLSQDQETNWFFFIVGKLSIYISYSMTYDIHSIIIALYYEVKTLSY